MLMRYAWDDERFFPKYLDLEIRYRVSIITKYDFWYRPDITEEALLTTLYILN